MYIIVGLVTTYSHVQLYPVIVEDLDIDPSVKAPKKRKMRGKITKKRKQKGSQREADFQG
jgi:hypothetical protein